MSPRITRSELRGLNRPRQRAQAPRSALVEQEVAVQSQEVGPGLYVGHLSAQDTDCDRLAVRHVTGSFSVFIPGRPVPQGRPRLGRGRVYDPPASRAWKERIGWHVKSLGLPRLSGPVRMRLDFRLELGQRGDLSNFVKAVEDALTGIAYHDDAQIRRLVVDVWEATGELGVRVEVAGLTGPPPSATLRT